MSILQSNESHITINADGASKEVRFQNNGTQNMVLDSSGNVGIGTSSPTHTLEVNGGANNQVVKLVSTDAYAAIGLQDSTSSTDGSGNSYNSIAALGNNLTFWANNAERMRIDSSGNLLVGTTSTTIYSATSGGGFLSIPNGSTTIARQSNTSTQPIFILNETGIDGVMQEFRKDGTAFGSIGVQSDDRLTIGCNDIGIGFVQDADAIVPWNDSTKAYVDNKIDLGTSSQGFKDLYLSGGVYVGGTGSANYLDDYEEGTFTPTLLGSTSNPSYTGGYQGKYIKIGKIVHFSLYIDTNPYSTDGSGSVRVGGLPFTVNGDNGGWAPAIPVSLYGPSIGSGKHISGQPIDNQSYLQFRIWGDNVGMTVWDFSTASWSSGDAIYIQGHYFTD